MIQVCNLWVKWIVLGINQTNESQINSNGNDDQPYPIEQFTIRPNAPIIIIRPRVAEVGGLKLDVGK